MFEVWQEEEEEKEEEQQQEKSAEDMGALTGARWRKRQFSLFNYLFFFKKNYKNRPKRRAAATGGGQKRLRSRLETLFIMQAKNIFSPTKIIKFQKNKNNCAKSSAFPKTFRPTTTSSPPSTLTPPTWWPATRTPRNEFHKDLCSNCNVFLYPVVITTKNVCLKYPQSPSPSFQVLKIRQIQNPTTKFWISLTFKAWKEEKAFKEIQNGHFLL